MESEYVTTPFGRRPMTLGMLASQQHAKRVEPGIKRNKWKLFRAICEARPALGITDRALMVLDALLSFYPEDDLSQERGLVVFPSNAQLSLRARGMTPATLRRHLAVLIDAGLILRKDSPNGKRYARRDREGAVGEAYGFSLAPLLSRAIEIESHAARVVADRDFLRATKERLTLCRRDVSKLLATVQLEAIPGDWEAAATSFRLLVARIPRVATLEILTLLLDELTKLRCDLVNLLEEKLNAQKIDANESQIERHIQDSHPDSIYELEPAFETTQADISALAKKSEALRRNIAPAEWPASSKAADPEPGQANTQSGRLLKSFPLGLVLQACPEIRDYGPGGTVNSWRDLMSAAVVVRSMLGVSPSAHEEACSRMGPENAAVVIACILERGGHINSAGGYLRDLTRRAEKGEFAVGPMLMALMRVNGGAMRQIG